MFDGTYYLYAAGGSSNNYLKGASNAVNANAKWNISINDGLATIKTTDTTVLKNTIRFNTGSTLFSCYSSGQDDIQIFKYQTKNVVTEYTPSIALSKAIKSYCA